MISANEALERLKSGNQRFVESIKNKTPISKSTELITDAQTPFAIILGCSDARVPAEMVFDQGLGDLFVIRVAGNVVAPSQVGSIEYAAEQFQTPLVVVLGHSQCGAVEATVEQLKYPTTNRSPNLRSIVDRISPSVKTLLETPLADNEKEVIHYSVRANVRSSVGHLERGSKILEQLIGQGGLQVVGAQYFIESGKVEFFD